MGLRNVLITITAVAAISSVSGCASIRTTTPADRVTNETFRYDCCNPGLDEGTKWMCDMAIKKPDHTLRDADGNRYEYIWSDCEIGKEPWRKYE